MSKKNSCKIISLNVRGIRNPTKRSSIFTYLKDQRAVFYFLQETYSETGDELFWKNEWGGEIYFSHGTRHSKGVCILFDPSIDVNKVKYFLSDNSGRIVLINLNYNGMELSLCNVYAPNDHADQLRFIKELNNYLIDKSELTALIVGGDWNCTLTKKDKKGGLPWRPSGFRNSILVTMDIFDLVDIQRVKYPNVNKYSYESKALKVRSRIDFFLIAKNLTKYVQKVDIHPSIAPDHWTISLSLQWTKEVPRGPGFWKFNNTLLNDDNYIQQIRRTYPETRAKYEYIQDKRTLWELLKMELRSVTISYAKGKAKETSNREYTIKDELEKLDHIICNSRDLMNIDYELKQYEDLKKELQQLYEKKGEAAKFRSKCLWVEKGERPTKYFFNLEKRNYSRRVISELELEEGDIITNEKQILSEIESYFMNLYSSKTDVSEEHFSSYVEQLEFPRLSHEMSLKAEGLLTYEECKESLDTFSPGKSPGEDGFTVEFYLTFFDLIGEDLVNSLNSAYQNGELSISQRRGVISLIPKEDSSLLKLENWRPLTLLNVDYKIASKAIAKRIEPLLSFLIHPDQTGFVKDRYIGENIRLISDIMEQTKKLNCSGILLSLDFQKAFDTLEWSCISNVLKMYNFGDCLRTWIKVLYTKVESTVLNNGFATNWFKPSAGVRQGCPLSPYLFILTAELMSNKIRQSIDFKGISVFEKEIKVSQFADDTNLFCADLSSVEKGLQIVADFGAISGLKLNIKKTKAMWLGKWANNKDKPLHLKWVSSPTRILGIYFSYDEKGNNEMNFDLKINKLQAKLDIWRSRDLTLFGKTMIIKTLGVSSLIYSASNINVPNDIAGNVKRRLFSFLWKNKRDKIKREGLYQDYHNGGLRMTDIETMIKALRLAWIPRLLKNGQSNWKFASDHFLKSYGGLRFLLTCNYHVKDFQNMPLFYRDILLYFHELKTLYGCDVGDTILFNNKEIRIDGKTFFWKEWFMKGIKRIEDLFDENGQVLPFPVFQRKYSLKKISFLHYFQVISAIPGHLLAKAKSKDSGSKGVSHEDLESFCLAENVNINLLKAKSKDFYWLIIHRRYNDQHSGPRRWNRTITEDKTNWKKIFRSVRKVCKENKLREFHFKFIHRVVVTKKELFRFNIKPDSNCVYCGESDSIDHTFIECQFTKSFTQEVLQWFNVNNSSNFILNAEDVLFGLSSASDTLTKKLNYTLLFLRYYIYKCKLQNNSSPLQVVDFINKIKKKIQV